MVFLSDIVLFEAHSATKRSLHVMDDNNVSSDCSFGSNLPHLISVVYELTPDSQTNTN